MTISDAPVRVLHIANWFPNPWDSMDGNFVRDQIRQFSRGSYGRVVHVQVRQQSDAWLSYRSVELEDQVRGYYLLTRLPPGKIVECLSTFLLLYVLLRERVWRFDALHVHIAYPLLVHAHLWKWIFRRPIIISEHWSAYHFNFYLPEGAKALRVMSAPFRNGFPVIAVSQALLDDITRFAGRDDFRGYVIPNVVPCHGHVASGNRTPALFTVNRWGAIKDPMPMLQGLARAAQAGASFELVVGGFGAMIEEMQQFVEQSALAGRTQFLGMMTKPEIAAQLAASDGYIFSSRYETFSIACAEALGAGVPLIGPYIPAIAEYAGPECWELVEGRSVEGWTAAVRIFLEKWNSGYFDPPQIAAAAARRFSPERGHAAYRDVLSDTLCRAL